MRGYVHPEWVPQHVAVHYLLLGHLFKVHISVWFGRGYSLRSNHLVNERRRLQRLNHSDSVDAQYDIHFKKVSTFSILNTLPNRTSLHITYFCDKKRLCLFSHFTFTDFRESLLAPSGWLVVLCTLWVNKLLGTSRQVRLALNACLHAGLHSARQLYSVLCTLFSVL